MTDERTTYFRKEVLLILDVSDSTLLRMKGHEVHPWADPTDPSGRRLLYDRAAIDKLARRIARRGLRRRGRRTDPPPVRAVRGRTARPRDKTPPEPVAAIPRRDRSAPTDDPWAKEIDARRARGEPDFPDDVVPSSRRKR
jgi:hypothetical protein